MTAPHARQPALFVGHGNPMNGLPDNANTRAGRRLGARGDHAALSAPGEPVGFANARIEYGAIDMLAYLVGLASDDTP